MKRRWNANTLVLTILGTILLLVGIDIGRRLVAGPVSEKPPEPVSATPSFKVGDLAPDFTMNDGKRQPHKLSDLVKRDTLLTFSCGCNQCKEYQTWTGKILPPMGKDVPDVISLNTTSPDSAEAWKRDTKLPQLMLYGSHTEGPIGQYQGHPCPRAFRLSKDRKVTWIGGSRKEGRTIQQLGMELAQELRTARYSKKPPEMEWTSDGPMQGAPPPGPPGPQAPPAPPVADDHAGHDHKANPH